MAGTYMLQTLLWKKCRTESTCKLMVHWKAQCDVFTRCPSFRSTGWPEQSPYCCCLRCRWAGPEAVVFWGTCFPYSCQARGGYERRSRERQRASSTKEQTWLTSCSTQTPAWPGRRTAAGWWRQPIQPCSDSILHLRVETATRESHHYTACVGSASKPTHGRTEALLFTPRRLPIAAFGFNLHTIRTVGQPLQLKWRLWYFSLLWDQNKHILLP